MQVLQLKGPCLFHLRLNVLCPAKCHRAAQKQHGLNKWNVEILPKWMREMVQITGEEKESILGRQKQKQNNYKQRTSSKSFDGKLLGTNYRSNNKKNGYVNYDTPFSIIIYRLLKLGLQRLYNKVECFCFIFSEKYKGRN